MRRRPQTLTRAQFQLVLAELGVRLDDLRDGVEETKSLEACEDLVAAFKKSTRKAFKRRLFEVHPDRNRAEDAEERTKALTGVQAAFLATLDTLKARPPRPQRREVIVSHHYDFVRQPPRGHTGTGTVTPSSKWAQRTIDDALRNAVGGPRIKWTREVDAAEYTAKTVERPDDMFDAWEYVYQANKSTGTGDP